MAFRMHPSYVGYTLFLHARIKRGVNQGVKRTSPGSESSTAGTRFLPQLVEQSYDASVRLTSDPTNLDPSDP